MAVFVKPPTVYTSLFVDRGLTVSSVALPIEQAHDFPSIIRGIKQTT